MTKHEYNWRLKLTVPGCHRWFEGVTMAGDRGVAVCDDSGLTPDLTDDGVIWLARGRAIIVDSTREEHRDHPAGVPVTIHGVSDSGLKKLIGGTNGFEAQRLHEEFGIALVYTNNTELQYQ